MTPCTPPATSSPISGNCVLPDRMRALLLLAAIAVAAIGIGVGVISASGATSYGPLGERFTAAFVSNPRVVQARVGGEHAIGYCAKDSTTSETVMIVDNLGRVTSTSYAVAVQVLSRAGCAIVGWVAYSPLSDPDRGSRVGDPATWIRLKRQL